MIKSPLILGRSHFIFGTSNYIFEKEIHIAKTIQLASFTFLEVVHWMLSEYETGMQIFDKRLVTRTDEHSFRALKLELTSANY